MKTEKNYFDLLISITNDENFSSQLAKELIESEENPLEFYNKHRENHFTNRGIDEAGNSEQSLSYLLDKLEDNNFLRELDYKANSEELNDALKHLSKGKIEKDFFTEEDEEESNGMFEMLFDAEDYLEEFDLAIVQFPLDSDSHPIALVPLERSEEIQTMIDELFEEGLFPSQKN
jgi:Zn-dependent M16 (insulinase) family peptidase